MSNVERIRRSWLVRAGAVVVLGSWAPLALYVVFGPADGNPIGLGLLFFFGTLAGGALLALGVLAA